MAYSKKITGITIKIDGDTSGLVKSLDQVSSKVSKVGKSIENVGKDLTRNLTVPIATAFTGIIKETADFDAQMSKVQAISGATADEYDTLAEKAREMGKTTKFSATESGEALEYMAMAGWKTEEMLNGIDGIMNLAAAAGEELGTTSDIVTDALTAFGMSAEDAGRFADILAAAATNSNTTVSKMGESFKYVAPVAGSLGYSAEDVAIALGLMANSGIKADMAGTSLRNMFTRMAKPTKESQAALDRLGLSLQDDEGNMYSFREIMDQLRKSFSEINMSANEYDAELDKLDQALEDGTITQKKYDSSLEELNKQAFGVEGAEKARAAAMLGGTRAMSGLLAIANASTTDYQNLTMAIDGSSEAMAKLADGSVVPLNDALASGEEILETYNGQAEAMAAIMNDNLKGDLTILKSDLSELAISLGELMMPLLRELVEKIKSVVDWLNSLSDEQKEHILKIAAIVAAVGPVLIIIGKLVTGIGSIISIASGLIAVISAISAPVLIVIGVIAALVAAGVLLYKNWDTICEWAGKLKDTVMEKINLIKEGVPAAFNFIKDSVSKKWNETKNNVVTTTKIVTDAMAKGFEEAKTRVGNKVNEIKSNMLNTFNNIKTGIHNTISGIYTTIVNGLQSAIDWLRNLPSQALNWGRDLIISFINGIWDKISSVADIFTYLSNLIASYIHFSEPDKGALSNFHTFMPDMINSLVNGIEAGIPKVASAMDQLSSTMVPATAGGTSNVAYNNQMSVNVYGTPGMDVQELADAVQDRINMMVYQTGAAFA